MDIQCTGDALSEGDEEVRLIDADLLIDELDSTFFGNNPRDVVKATIYAMPTAITYCKYCKHRLTDECPMYEEHWEEYDDDEYIESELIMNDRTVNEGWCYKGEPEE